MIKDKKEIKENKEFIAYGLLLVTAFIILFSLLVIGIKNTGNYKTYSTNEGTLSVEYDNQNKEYVCTTDSGIYKVSIYSERIANVFVPAIQSKTSYEITVNGNYVDSFIIYVNLG